MPLLPGLKSCHQRAEMKQMINTKHFRQPQEEKPQPSFSWKQQISKD